LVVARQQALLELRGAELVRGPAELLGDEDLDIQCPPLGIPEEVAADPFSFEEGIGAVYRALENVCDFLAAEAHPLELLCSGRDAQADGKDALAAPVPLRGLESVQGFFSNVSAARRSGTGLTLVFAFERHDDGGCDRRLGGLFPPLRHRDSVLAAWRSLRKARLDPSKLFRARLRRGVQARSEAPDLVTQSRFESCP
jgi:hypothetical protein